MSSPPDRPVTPANPQEQLLFLLGGMNAKIDGIATAQQEARTEAAEFRNEVRNEMSDVRVELGDVKGRVVALEAKQVVRLRWPAIVGGIAGIATATTGGILLIQWLASNTAI